MYLDFFGKLCINIFFEVILEIIKLGLKGISVYFEFVYIFKEPVSYSLFLEWILLWIFKIATFLKKLYVLKRLWSLFETILEMIE